ncbi:hypothetical protein [Metabacillus rhizolycopersici]|uniref:Uncharacterized protein n=1 Tax=Metabacillus rhizolycopersici TaxID=2875709 RepID=A0ABS7UWN9_9BACI|nr:hypothetical protein [Metabacillus rhizolycopersici]MBZ5752417.1 hypothetical protein [Metabacillus rhizolycopersici]
MLEEARIELTVEDYWKQYAYESYRDAKLDWEADMVDLAEQQRGGFNRD